MAFLMIVHVPFEPIEESTSYSKVNDKDLQDISENAEDDEPNQPNEDLSDSNTIDDGQSESNNNTGQTAVETSGEDCKDLQNTVADKESRNDLDDTKTKEGDTNADEEANSDCIKEKTQEKTVKDNLDDNAQAVFNDLSNGVKVDKANVVLENEATETLVDQAKDEGTDDLSAQENTVNESSTDELRDKEELRDETKDCKILDALEEVQSSKKMEMLTPTTIGNLIPLVVKVPLYQEVENLLIPEVKNLEKALVGNAKYMRFSFIEDDSKQCESILNMLKAIGVGFAADTSVSIFPSSVHESGTVNLAAVSSEKSLNELQGEELLHDTHKENVFKKSIKSRLVVAQVISSVRGGALFTFDFLLLVLLARMICCNSYVPFFLIASLSFIMILTARKQGYIFLRLGIIIISCVGLVESSSVVLVASMLISPLMGPILAGTFGQVVKMKDLRNLGLKSELLGLSLCVLVGFVIGLITGGIGLQGAVWGSSDQWPTPEMKSRGMLRSLWVGTLIAVPSGAGVAISVLSANAGSLVGVAISASLLPPACNAGMLWGYALVAAISPPEVINTVIPVLTTMASSSKESVENVTFPYVNVTNTTDIPQLVAEVSRAGSLHCPALVKNAYEPVYSCNVAIDAVVLGTVSLILTILNIIFIFAVGIVFLKIKEVAPHTAGKEKAADQFWHEDVKVARTYYEVRKGAESSQLGKQFLEEWRKIKSSRNDSMVEGTDTIEMCNYFVEMQNSQSLQDVISGLNSTTPDLMTDLMPEYDRARTRVEEELVKHPGFVLSNTDIRSIDKNIMRAYHTLSTTAPDTDRPSLFDMRRRFRKMGGVQSMYIETEDNPTPKISRFLSKPVDSSLGKRRRERKAKTVKFEVQRVDEQQPLVIS